MQGTIKAEHPQSGAEAEALATAYLERNDCRIIATNYRFRGGELDIIARHGDSLAFVEVKYRTSDNFGSAAEHLRRGQQARLRRGAAIWLGKHDPRSLMPCRFDLLALSPLGPGQVAVEWLMDAF